MPVIYTFVRNKLKNGKLSLLLLLLVVVLGLYFVGLDSDPGMFKRIGDIGDGAAWAHEARNKILYGKFITDDYNQAAAVGPLTLISHFVTFSLLGVSLSSLTLTTTIFQILSVLFTYLLFRKAGKHAIIYALFVACSFNLYLIGRSGMPLTLHGFFAILTFYLLEVKRNPWLAGISFALGVYSSLNFILFLPVIFLYLVIKYIRMEIIPSFFIKFFLILGFFGIAFLLYQHTYKDIFAKTLACVSQGFISPVGYWGYLDLIKQNILNFLMSILTLPKTFLEKEVFMGSYSPGNALMIFVCFIYLYKLNLFNIIDKNWKKHLKELCYIDIIIISWLIIYPITLLFFSDLAYHRFQLMSWVICLVGARVISTNDLDSIAINSKSNKSRAIKWIEGLSSIYLTLLLIEYLWGHIFRIEYKLGLLVIVVLVAAALYKANRIVFNKIFNIYIWCTFIFILSATLIIPFIKHFFPWEILPIYFKALIYIFLILMFSYLLHLHLKKYVLIVLIINIFLILIKTVTPTYSIRDTSNYISNIIDSNDYVAGPDAILTSMNGKFHPLWWIPNYIYGNQDLGIWNKEFIKIHKPTYLIYCDKNRGNYADKLWTGENLDGYWPTKNNLMDIGAKEFILVREFDLFPYFNTYEMHTQLYKILY